jgi:hypothetical protein
LRSSASASIAAAVVGAVAHVGPRYLTERHVASHRKHSFRPPMHLHASRTPSALCTQHSESRGSGGHASAHAPRTMIVECFPTHTPATSVGPTCNYRGWLRLVAWTARGIGAAAGAASVWLFVRTDRAVQVGVSTLTGGAGVRLEAPFPVTPNGATDSEWCDERAARVRQVAATPISNKVRTLPHASPQ